MTPGLLRIAAFSDGDRGGNPAGVLITDSHPDSAEMRRMAAEIGYSETAFAMPDGNTWRVRYFSPESEVPFCGHATIALGAALAERHGEGVFRLKLNRAEISVEGWREGGRIRAALQSPPTRSAPLPQPLLDETLALFALRPADLDSQIPPARIHGAPTTWRCASNRATRSRQCITTSTAAFAGYLRDLDWPHEGAIEILQGEDMGQPSRLYVEIPPAAGSSIRVSGSTRPLGGGPQ